MGAWEHGRWEPGRTRGRNGGSRQKADSKPIDRTNEAAELSQEDGGMGDTPDKCGWMTWSVDYSSSMRESGAAGFDSVQFMLSGASIRIYGMIRDARHSKAQPLLAPWMRRKLCLLLGQMQAFDATATCPHSIELLKAVCTSVLIEHGADANVSGAHGGAPLHMPKWKCGLGIAGVPQGR